MTAEPCPQHLGIDDPWATNLHSLRLEELVDASRTADPWPRGLPGPTPDEARSLQSACEVVCQVDDVMMAMVLRSATLLTQAVASLESRVRDNAVLAALAARRLRRLMVSPWLASPALDPKPSDAMRCALNAVLTRLDAVRANDGSTPTSLQGPGQLEVRSAAGPSAQLSARELEVARYVSMGMTNKQIAIQLKLSPNTIKRHLARILRRLDLGKRSAVASWYAVRQPTSSLVRTVHELSPRLIRTSSIRTAPDASQGPRTINFHQ